MSDSGGAPHPTDVHVGRRVRLRRKMLGLSQENLADALGLTFQQIQKYERGANRISASRLHEIAKVLSAPISFFFDGLGDGDDAKDESARIVIALAEELVADPLGVQVAQGFLNIRRGATRRALAELAKALGSGEPRGSPREGRRLQAFESAE